MQDLKRLSTLAQSKKADNVRRQRLLIVLTILVVALVVRLDHAIGAAVETDWLPAAERQERAASEEQFYWCQDRGTCPRLPWAWVWVYRVAAVPVAVLPAIALLVFLRKVRNQPHHPKARSAKPWTFRGAFTRGSFIRNAYIFTALSVVAGLVAAAARAFYVTSNATDGYGEFAAGTITCASLCQVVFLGIAALMGARTFLKAGRPERHATGWAPLWAFCSRQRIQLLIVVLYVLALVAMPVTGDQSRDAIRFVAVSSFAGLLSAAALLLSALLLAFVLHECGVRCETDPAVAQLVKKPINIKACVLAGAALCALGAALFTAGVGSAAPAVAGCVLFALALLELPGRSEHNTSGQRDDPAAAVPTPEAVSSSLLAVRSLALAPLTALAVTTFLAGMDSIQSGNWLATEFIGTMALLSVLVAVIAAWPQGSVQSGSTARARYGMATPLAIAIGVLAIIAVHLSPHRVSLTIGALGLVNLATAAAVAALFLISRVARQYRPPYALQWLGVHSFPTVTVLAVWLLLLGIPGFGTSQTLSDVRLRERARMESGEFAPTPTITSAFSLWQKAQPELAARTEIPAGTSPPVIPLVLVAGQGGGIRAAYWTALILDCIVGGSPSPIGHGDGFQPFTEKADCGRRRDMPEWQTSASRIFLASGVSGGAVGLQAYARQLVGGTLATSAWVDDRLGRDLLSPAVGWTLFHDLPNRLLGLSPSVGGVCTVWLGQVCATQDRAAILEQSLTDDADTTDDTTLRGLWDARHRGDPTEARRRAQTVPLLVMNSTTPHAGLRATVSAADLGSWPSVFHRFEIDDPRPVSGAADVSDMLCVSKDVALSTAAFLSARFPLLSPPGRIGGACGVADRSDLAPEDTASWRECSFRDRCATQMVDGGYVDNSGLLTIAQILPALTRLVNQHNDLVRSAGKDAPTTLIALLVVEADNHYFNDATRFEVEQFRSIPETLVAFRALFGKSAHTGTIARGILENSMPPVCRMTIVPAAHPGLTPPLGWLLSKASRSELREALTRRAPSSDNDDVSDREGQLLRLQSWLGPYGRILPQLQEQLMTCAP